MAKIDEGVWALHVWRSPDGNVHPQWSGPGDPRLCRCGERHTLADAPARLICPGVAHVDYTRPCVLCGLGWRVRRPDTMYDIWTPGPDLKSTTVAAGQVEVPPLPGSGAVRDVLLGEEWINSSGNCLHQSQPSITGAGSLGAPTNHVYIDVVQPRAPRCIYCMTLVGRPLELARHLVQDHTEESH